MFTNHFDVKIHNDAGTEITVGLRLPISEQIALKKKYGEDTRTTIFSAGSDDEKLVDILTRALTWKGNGNTITDGVELLERLVDEGAMGIVQRQKLVIEIGLASGIFSEDERDGLMKRVDKMSEHMFGAESSDDDESNDEKNA